MIKNNMEIMILHVKDVLEHSRKLIKWWLKMIEVLEIKPNVGECFIKSLTFPYKKVTKNNQVTLLVVIKNKDLNKTLYYMRTESVLRVGKSMLSFLHWVTQKWLIKIIIRNYVSEKPKFYVNGVQQEPKMLTPITTKFTN